MHKRERELKHTFHPVRIRFSLKPLRFASMNDHFFNKKLSAVLKIKIVFFTHDNQCANRNVDLK